MSELLTSLDVVNQAFKKTMRGYDPSEVDEFLDRVAECIQVYVQKLKDYERVLEDQSEKLRDYENIKGSLHEALLMAQRTAEEKVTNATLLAEEKIAQADRISDETIGQATATADSILTDAKMKAERMLREAEASVKDFGHELTILQELRNSGFANMHAFINEIKNVLSKAESTGDIKIPTLTQNLIGMPGVYPGASTQANELIRTASEKQMAGENTYMTRDDEYDDPVQHVPQSPPLSPEQRQAQLTNTLNVLGIDLSLLDTNPMTGSDKP